MVDKAFCEKYNVQYVREWKNNQAAVRFPQSSAAAESYGEEQKDYGIKEETGKRDEGHPACGNAGKGLCDGTYKRDL